MIDMMAWYETIKEKVWWRDIGFNECFSIMKNTQRAIEAKSKYYINSPMGDGLELTELYEQCRILRLLKEEYHGTKETP